MPFSLKGAVEQEIHRLEELSVLEHVVHSEWAAPIVVVPKKDGHVRLCGDYKVTVNKFLDGTCTLCPSLMNSLRH